MHCIQKLIKTTTLFSIIFHNLMTLHSLGSCVYLNTSSVVVSCLFKCYAHTIYALFSRTKLQSPYWHKQDVINSTFSLIIERYVWKHKGFPISKQCALERAKSRAAFKAWKIHGTCWIPQQSFQQPGCGVVQDTPILQILGHGFSDVFWW